jgi:hypothetical protein
VSPATLPELEEFARRTLGPRLDAPALTAAYHEYLPRRTEALARFKFGRSGAPDGSLFAAITDPGFDFESAELLVVDPPKPGPAWEFLRPFSRLLFLPDGAAELFPLDGSAPVRAMVRVLLREHYAPPPETRTPAALRASLRTLATPARAVEFVRETGVVPFSVALLLYVSEERVRVELDVLEDRILRDPRAGRFPMGRRVRRPPRVAHAVDAYVARGTLPVLSARVLEVVAETHGTTAVELSPVFGGARELVQTTLQGLANRRLVSLDRRTGLFRSRFETMTPAGRADGAEASTPVANPQLRTSVLELIAAADSRATCPLCGDSLPPGYRGLLCARCQSEIGDAPVT